MIGGGYWCGSARRVSKLSARLKTCAQTYRPKRERHGVSHISQFRSPVPGFIGPGFFLRPGRVLNLSRCLWTKPGPNLVTPLPLAIEKFSDQTALIDHSGEYTYGDLLQCTYELAERIVKTCKTGTNENRLDDVKISYLCPNDLSYVATTLAVWLSGGVAVPLCISHPASEWKYFIEDSKSKLVLCTPEYEEFLRPIAESLDIPIIVVDKNLLTVSESENGSSNDVDERNNEPLWKDVINNSTWQLQEGNKFKRKPALVIYTSGTTGRPKGVVHTFGSLQSQVEGMQKAWAWSSSDSILHCLPLHHVHGVVNALMTPLYSGATCVMLPQFDARQIWNYLLGSKVPKKVNIFMGVPTMYVKLIEDFENRFARGRGTKRAKEYAKAMCSTKIRLMVSGSAALPVPVMTKWEELTGHLLLERYGMTETGMVLTNPLQGPRIPGAVGKPFPKMEVMVAMPNVYAEKGYDVICQMNSVRTVETPGLKEEVGELYVKGPNLFQEYFNRPEATQESFTADGWFKTGDTAKVENGVIKILGRTSVDIIKSGGYKISALEVERHLLAHENIADVAVIGIPDITWGQRVAAAVALKDTSLSLTLEDLRGWAKDKMPGYHVPSVLKVIDALPRNAMGKVNKKELQKSLFAREMKQSM